MSEPIKSALDPEEWEKWGPKIAASDHFDSITARADAIDEALKDWEPASFHAAAAFALHGQPFGFRRKDVVALRQSADALERAIVLDTDNERNAQRCRSLADRIEALLPPAT